MALDAHARPSPSCGTRVPPASAGASKDVLNEIDHALGGVAHEVSGALHRPADGPPDVVRVRRQGHAPEAQRGAARRRHGHLAGRAAALARALLQKRGPAGGVGIGVLLLGVPRPGRWHHARIRSEFVPRMRVAAGLPIGRRRAGGVRPVHGRPVRRRVHGRLRGRRRAVRLPVHGRLGGRWGASARLAVARLRLRSVRSAAADHRHWLPMGRRCVRGILQAARCLEEPLVVRPTGHCGLQGLQNTADRPLS
mmetsp:Transcript_59564/g.181871  ORF Transcript_59564/g.181871 Transcript_59564/m.181871 type:complete len:252 (+) Transcript_59564:119-874(+)